MINIIQISLALITIHHHAV